MANMNQLMKQAQQMQAKLSTLQKNLKPESLNHQQVVEWLKLQLMVSKNLFS